MRGAYGINAEGTRVFFGKYIDRLGRFRGFLRGRAYQLPVTPGGFYEGRWVTDCGGNDVLIQ